VTAAAPRTLPRVLCVDDDQLVLAWLNRLLRFRFDVHVTTAPIHALKMIDEAVDAPYAVILCDLEMPGVNGIALLRRVRELAPDTARILLTGHANIDSAIGAVNDGAVFRFLTKPCDADTLVSAIAAGAEQHRLAIAERVLLQQTLHGSVKALCDILTLVSPTAFARGTRLKRYVARVAAALGVTNQWEIEIAALLSQLGTVSLPPELVDKLHAGRALDSAEQLRVDAIPSIAASFIAEIPRLDEVCQMLLFQSTWFDGHGSPRAGVHGTLIPLGARILKIAMDLDMLEAAGMAPHVAIVVLASRSAAYDPKVLAAFRDSILQDAEPVQSREVRLGDVCAGMVFATDVVGPNGLLLAVRGQEVSRALTERLRDFWSGSLLDQEVVVMLPVGQT
jgi:response regulator RpfG family c-di-GMP phosphodiesterase